MSNIDLHELQNSMDDMTNSSSLNAYKLKQLNLIFNDLLVFTNQELHSFLYNNPSLNKDLIRSLLAKVKKKDAKVNLKLENSKKLFNYLRANLDLS